MDKEKSTTKKLKQKKGSGSKTRSGKIGIGHIIINGETHKLFTDAPMVDKVSRDENKALTDAVNDFQIVSGNDAFKKSKSDSAKKNSIVLNSLKH